MLNRDSILQAQDLKTVDEPIPEWGGDIRLRILTAAERFAINTAATVDGKFDPAVFQTVLIEAAAVNEDGTPMFQPGDAAALRGKSAPAISRAFEAAAKLNGLGNAAVDAAEKNS
jgi:hypothetical protein